MEKEIVTSVPFSTSNILVRLQQQHSRHCSCGCTFVLEGLEMSELSGYVFEDYGKIVHAFYNSNETELEKCRKRMKLPVDSYPTYHIEDRHQHKLRIFSSIKEDTVIQTALEYRYECFFVIKGIRPPTPGRPVQAAEYEREFWLSLGKCQEVEKAWNHQRRIHMYGL